MTRSWLALVALAACYHTQSPELGDGGGGSDIDAGSNIHGGIDAGSNCVGHLVPYCFTGTEPELLSSVDKTNTSDDATCTVIVDGTCVIAAGTISLVADNGAAIVFTGTRPVVFASAGNLTIDQSVVIEASSVAGRDGPGVATGTANDQGCGGPATPGLQAGGPGGAFSLKGGKGGGTPFVLSGDANKFPPSLAGTGCPGDAGDGGAAGGHPGGVVLFEASSQLLVSGRVIADGAGGSGGAGNNGAAGGGGGTGGLIVLDSGQVGVTDTGNLQAVGGGGGGGSSGTTAGRPGTDGNQGGGGGSGGAPNGGQGGDGGGHVFSNATEPPTDGASGLVEVMPSGGGGGGGAPGFILVFGIFTPLAGAVIQPLPTQP